MEDYKKYQIPAFGYWDFSDDLPITQYFESARHAGLLRYSAGDGERDLYGDDLKMANVNVMMTTAAVSQPKIKRSLKPCQEEHVKEQKKLGRVCDLTEEPRRTRAPKAVDEDLYKIPPELLHEKPKRVGGEQDVRLLVKMLGAELHFMNRRGCTLEDALYLYC